jgi:hypothetical protein
MREDVKTGEQLVVVVGSDALNRAAEQTLSRLTRLRMRVPEGARPRVGDQVVITDEERSYKVIGSIDAVEADVMLVDPTEVVSTARSYRERIPTPQGS